MGLKPLGIVKEVVEAAGMGISYVYEDLVFIEHNAFLLQFTEKDNTLLIHINTDADETVLQQDILKLKEEAIARKILLENGVKYSISQDSDENIRLEFIE